VYAGIGGGYVIVLTCHVCQLGQGGDAKNGHCHPSISNTSLPLCFNTTHGWQVHHGREGGGGESEGCGAWWGALCRAGDTAVFMRGQGKVGVSLQTIGIAQLSWPPCPAVYIVL
jgi:hypothetical protein